RRRERPRRRALPRRPRAPQPLLALLSPGRHRAGTVPTVRVLVPVPDHDVDVTEIAVPWKLLTEAGHEIVFATERAGTVPEADPRLLDGVIFGRLGAAAEPKAFHRELVRSPAWRNTEGWIDLR